MSTHDGEAGRQPLHRVPVPEPADLAKRRPRPQSLGMGKYDPLSAWLRRRPDSELELSFREIEAKIGYMLPNIASRADWWASDGEPGPREVQKAAWRSAGFDARLLAGERVCFTRIKTLSVD